MDVFQRDLWWAGALLIVIVISIIAMLLRNRAAKTDSVLHSEKDTIANSVSLHPKKKTKKLD